MICKHNRILKEMRLTDTTSSDLGIQYMDTYVCAHCGAVMEVKEHGNN